MKKWMTGENSLVLIVIGILFMVVLFPRSQKGENSKSSLKDNQNLYKETSVTEEMDSYRERMEKETEEILEQIEGAGKVEVMITLECSYETVSENAGSLFSENQNNNTRKTYTPKITGILVVASGAGESQNTEILTQAVMSLFHLEANKVKVVKMKKS